MNLTELLSLLNELGVRPKKGLSQNFLIDSNVVHKIVDLAEVKEGDRVLEIGPGTGTLTRALLQAGAEVIAVEKDRVFAEHLRGLEGNKLRVVEGDVLKFDWTTLRHPPYKVVANLPYQITTPILELVCEHASLFSSVTIMVQKEVGDRIRAKPSTKAFGSLTLFLQFYTSCRGAFAVSRSCFFPSPNVDSTVLRLDLRSSPPMDPALLFPLSRAAFQQRRKMITTSLKKKYPQMGETLSAVGISPRARPEELSLEQWVALALEVNKTNVT